MWVNYDYLGVGVFVCLFDIVCYVVVVYMCFCGVIVKYYYQFCIGDIIWIVVVVVVEYIVYGCVDLGGVVVIVMVEIVVVGVYQVIWYVRIGNIVVVYVGIVKDMYCFVVVVFEDMFQVIVDGI